MLINRTTQRRLAELLNKTRRREQQRGEGAADVQYAARVVRVRKVGGNAGGPSGGTNCTFTYNFWYKGSTGTASPLNSSPQQPLRARIPRAEYEPPADDTEGLAYFDASGWHLLEVYLEKLKSEECE